MSAVLSAHRRTALRALFAPNAVAVVGASADPFKPSGQPVLALKRAGFPGGIYPVNPKYDEILNRRCYKSLADLPESPELAIIALPPPLVPNTLADCAQAGVKAVIVLTSGYGEAGEAGEALEENLRQTAREFGLLLCGPNCMGVLSTPSKLMANFLLLQPLDESHLSYPQSFSFVGQSGGICARVFEGLGARGVGYSRMVSSGNEADLTFGELLAYYAEDPQTPRVGAYLENTSDPNALDAGLSALWKVGKPIVLLKGGRSDTGVKACRRHTGADAAEAAALRELLLERGVILVETVSELVEALAVMATGRPLRGSGVGVVTTLGGVGVNLVDRLVVHGLTLPPLEDAARENIRALIPPFASHANPLDITPAVMADPARVDACMRAVLENPGVDALVTCNWYWDGYLEKQLAGLVALHATYPQPQVHLVWGAESTVRAGLAYLRGRGVPATESVEAAARSLSALHRSGKGTS